MILSRLRVQIRPIIAQWAVRSLSNTLVAAAPVSESLLLLFTLQTPEDHSEARSWLDNFQVNHIPKEAWEAGYSRSSGPGGQVSIVQ